MGAGMPSRGRCPQIQRGGWIPVHVDASRQVITGFSRALVVLQQRLEKHEQYGLRRESGHVQHLNVELALLLRPMHGDVQRDHVRARAHHSADCGFAVFGKCADGFAGIDDLDGLERRGQRGDDLRLRHGKGDGAGLQDRVPARQQLLRVDIGHRAGGRQFHVAPHQLDTDRGSGHDFGGRHHGGFTSTLRRGAHPACRHQVQPCACHPLLPKPDRLGRKAAHDQRRCDRLKRRLCVGKPCRGTRKGTGGNHTLLIVPRFFQWPADGNIANLEHVLDRGNARDGVFAELADMVGNRAQEFVPDIDRTAAHAGHHARVFRLGTNQLGQDHVVPRTPRSAQNTQNLHFHRLRLGATENRPGRPFHSALHFAQGKESAGGGRGPGGRFTRLTFARCNLSPGRWRVDQAYQKQGENDSAAEHAESGRAGLGFLHTLSHVYKSTTGCTGTLSANGAFWLVFCSPVRQKVAPAAGVGLRCLLRRLIPYAGGHRGAHVPDVPFYLSISSPPSRAGDRASGALRRSSIRHARRPRRRPRRSRSLTRLLPIPAAPARTTARSRCPARRISPKTLPRRRRPPRKSKTPRACRITRCAWKSPRSPST